MGNVKLTTFYPDNGTTSATEVNANSFALASSTSAINQENIRNEARDRFLKVRTELTKKDIKYFQTLHSLAFNLIPFFTYFCTSFSKRLVLPVPGGPTTLYLINNYFSFFQLVYILSYQCVIV